MTDTITLPDTPLTEAERRENAADLHITLADARDNAAEAVFRDEQFGRLAMLNGPKTDTKPKLTLRQRWKVWLRSRRMTVIQRQLAAEQERLAGLTEAANRAKHAAQLAYGVHLQQIACWRDTEAALAKSEIRQLSAELELLEAEQC